MTLEELRAELKRRLIAKYGTQTAFDEASGVQESTVSNLLTRSKNVPDWVLMEFGFKKIVTYAEVA